MVAKGCKNTFSKYEEVEGNYQKLQDSNCIYSHRGPNGGLSFMGVSKNKTAKFITELVTDQKVSFILDALKAFM